MLMAVIEEFAPIFPPIFGVPIPFDKQLRTHISSICVYTYRI